VTRDPQIEPAVGIFWLVNGRLIIDSTQVSGAESYGDCLTHARSHLKYWTELQRKGVVPPEVEYEELPRGRVVMDGKTGRFIVWGDRCILRRKSLRKQVLTSFHLVDCEADFRSDEHYRCFGCLTENESANEI
jgi:hypothetical protein